MMAGYGVGASLASLGQAQAKEAMGVAAEGAKEESRRNQTNMMLEQQRKSGNTQLGATAGALYGSSFGPWGTLIGGALGALAGGSL
jgi:hypothetical protein